MTLGDIGVSLDDCLTACDNSNPGSWSDIFFGNSAADACYATCYTNSGTRLGPTPPEEILPSIAQGVLSAASSVVGSLASGSGQSMTGILILVGAVLLFSRR